MNMNDSSAPDAKGQFDHAVVWIDHRSARVMHFDRDRWALTVVDSPRPTLHLHHKASSIDSGHAKEDQSFLHEVVRAIGNRALVLITGPANEKTELMKHIEKHDHSLRQRVAAVQAADHPSDGELLADARAYFRADDRMRSQT